MFKKVRAWLREGRPAESGPPRSRSSAVERAVGILLFLPVPVVLWLFTRQPLGVRASLIAGVALMVTHRLYARPWARSRAGRRCLWCGGGTGVGTTPVDIDEPGSGTAEWQTCGPAHAERLRAFLGWAQRRALLLRAGIVGAVVLFLAAAVLFGRIGRPGLDARLAADAFRLAIALLVLPLGWLGPRARPVPGTPRAPFPVHIQALVGSVAVAWLFRLVGVYWLVDAGLALVRRFAAH